MFGFKVSSFNRIEKENFRNWKMYVRSLVKFISCTSKYNKNFRCVASLSSLEKQTNSASQFSGYKKRSCCDITKMYSPILYINRNPEVQCQWFFLNTGLYR